ncbi:glutaredoxin family protein [Halomonas halocynthiae]|uniref:glutaredoxin family protein n=1 Tax=Halomonas halocynthiae TaxID=176290 RepID=UPI00040538FA|nr:glutaredoxin family protein [Halomonas halocynthiae]
MRLRLYTTLGCHLCSELGTWLERLANQPLTLERVEISDDEALVQRYGVRIPVLADEQGQELERGFEPVRLAQWLAERGWLDEAAWQKASRGEDEKGSGTKALRGAHMRQGRRYLN